jgi:hypothetical protein
MDLIPLRGLLLAMGGFLALDLLGRVWEATGLLRMSGNPALLAQFVRLTILFVRLIQRIAAYSTEA